MKIDGHPLTPAHESKLEVSYVREQEGANIMG